MPENEEEKMTLDKLALMVGRGFNEVGGRLDKVDSRLDKVDVRLMVIETDLKEVKSDIVDIKAGIRDLAGTLDAFLKRLTDREEEFIIMKREMEIVKSVLKEKLNVDVDALK